MCGGPPNGACMHMTFEKIDPPRKIPEGLEHPAAQAAKIIKQLHLDTIAKADAGFVFEKDGKDVTFDVIDACHKQIDICDQIIARADQMPVSLAGDAFVILKDLEDLTASKKEMKVLPDEQLPEIGNYDHKKT